MKIKYKIISENSIERLNESVQSKIDEGWLPQGGVTAANGSNFIFAQAMVKEEN
jgi:hypothetical protein